MNVSSAIFLAIAIITALYGVIIFNGLVRLKHNVARAWANIDVLLKQRHDELPKLVQVCRQYSQFEQATLARVVDARAQVSSARERHDLPALGVAEGALRSGLGQLFAVAEAHPDLRANEHFMQLQSRITALENAIADRREGYNEAVNIFNVRIEQFPDLVVARLFQFAVQPLLEFAAAEKTDVDLRTLFSA
ncbi:MAG: LemA family protein [Zoogloeaceae bacterium]|nr:LemA family protein [Zoogloeaceae bacterium]